MQLTNNESIDHEVSRRLLSYLVQLFHCLPSINIRILKTSKTRAASHKSTLKQNLWYNTTNTICTLPWLTDMFQTFV